MIVKAAGLVQAFSLLNFAGTPLVLDWALMKQNRLGAIALRRFVLPLGIEPKSKV